MNLRKLTSWFPELSYRQKVVSLILSGVIVGLGGLFFYLLRMQEGVSKCTHPLFYAQSPDFLKPGLCYFLKFLYL